MLTHIHNVKMYMGIFMGKKRWSLWAVIFVFCVQLFMTEPVCAETAEPPEQGMLYSKACALVDGDSGRLLYGKEERLTLPNASTTKILTCIVAMENCDMDEVVTFSKKAAAQPKVHLGTKEGEQFYLKDLLYGLMLESYNDCACAIAEHVSGSVEKFAEKMNEKAKEIGCTDSHFVTPNGLDATDEGGEHHTSAYDLCKIMSYCAWKSPKAAEFLALTQTKSHTFQSLSGTGYAVSNKNAFLDMMDEAITGKTGYTAKAGYCYVAAVEEGGRHYAIALLACGWPNHKTYRWSDAKTLFSYGLNAYHLYRGSKENLTIEDVKVAGGYEKGTLQEWGTHAKLSLSVDADPTNMTFLKADSDTAEMKKQINDSITLPVRKGQKVGSISYCINGEEIYSCPILAKNTVETWNIEKFFRVLLEEVLLKE